MVSTLLIGVIFLGLLLLLYFTGMPVAIAMGAAALLIMASPVGLGLDPQLVATRVMHSLNSFTMLAVPFYLLLGRLMSRIGMTKRIFRFASALVGWLRGGIGYVNIVASMIFSGMSGLAVADAAGLGRIEYTAMRNNSYDKRTALGVTGSSAIIGPIIPPSVLVIVYGLLADVSVGQLFLAGIVPGVLIGLLLMITLYVIIRLKGIENRQAFSWSELGRSFIHGIPGFMIPVFIIGGLTSGYFTATEAGGLAVIYTIVLGFFTKELSMGGLVQELQESMVETLSILFIIAMASIYSLVAVQVQVPRLISEAFLGASQDPTVILFLLIVLLLITGTFMPAIVSVTLLVPILIPVLDPLGIDPLYFGIVMLLTLMLGLLTPPFGMILFVLDKVTDARLEEIMRAMLPFYLPIALAIVLIVLFPEIVSYVPDVYYAGG